MLYIFVDSQKFSPAKVTNYTAQSLSNMHIYIPVHSLCYASKDNTHTNNTYCELRMNMNFITETLKVFISC